MGACTYDVCSVRGGGGVGGYPKSRCSNVKEVVKLPGYNRQLFKPSNLLSFPSGL